MSRIEQLISEIEGYIDGCKPQAFTNNKKIIVDKDEMEELLVELRLRTPDEIKKYQKIISNKEAILSSAQEEANGILGRARAEAEKLISEANEKAEQTISDAQKLSAEMLSEHEIVQQAYQQASDLMEQTNAQASELMEQTNAQAQELAEQANDQARQLAEQANAEAQRLINEAASASDNIKEGAIRYADDMLKNLQSIIGYTLEQTEGKYTAMLETLRSTYETVSRNRSELQVPVSEALPVAEPEKRQEKSSGGLNADMLG
ncbi:MAG: vacuolar family H+-ATPase subunit H [Lachnospiraceae bacterium]|nr:vacuolar family H+-ATPase subunit H [Lachnospiraceae bacterium]